MKTSSIKSNLSIKNSIQRQAEAIEKVAQKLENLTEEISDYELNDKIFALIDCLCELTDGESSRASFPEILDFIDEKLNDDIDE